MFLKKERRLFISSSLFYFLTFLPFLQNINDSLNIKYNNNIYHVYLINKKYIIPFKQNLDIEKKNFFIFYYYSYPHFFKKNYNQIKEIISQNIKNNKLNITKEYKQKIINSINSNSLYNKSLLLQISINLYSNIKNNNITFKKEEKFLKIYKHIKKQYNESQIFIQNYKIFIKQNFLITKQIIKNKTILNKIALIEQKDIPIIKKYMILSPLILQYIYKKENIFYNSPGYKFFSLLKLNNYQNSFISNLNKNIKQNYDYSISLKLYNYFQKFNKNILIQIIFVLILFVLSIILFIFSRNRYITYSAIGILFINIFLIILIRNNSIDFIKLANKKITQKRNFVIQKQPNLLKIKNSENLSTSIIKNKNILILGIGGLTHRDRKTHKPLGPFLTDAIIIANIVPHDSIINLISIPRDLFAENNKINSIYEKQGITTLKKTLKQITGLTIDNYFIIDFKEFKELIDIIGGITININKTFSDYDWLVLNKGINHLYGENCLKYLRSRRTTSDFSRSRRQHTIIKEIIKKLKNKQFIISNFFPLLDIYKKTNTDISLQELWDLYNISEKIKYLNSVVLSTANCLYSEYDDNFGYILYPKNDNFYNIKEYINKKINYKN